MAGGCAAGWIRPEVLAMVKTACKIIGVVLILVGIAGFFMPTLLGMHLTPIHDVIHIVSGALAAYFGFAGSPRAAATFALIFGAIYLLVAVLGFVAPGLLATILGHHGAVTARDLLPDNVVHVLLGGGLLVLGLAGRKG